MNNSIRPVGIGLVLGLLGLLFGISWAFYISLNHESIHRTFEEAGRASVEGKFVLNAPAASINKGAAGDKGHDHSAHDHAPADNGHKYEQAPARAEVDHDHGAHGQQASAGEGVDELKAAKPAHNHGSPEMEEAHRRLTRGHLHAMGLGVLTITISIVLSFLSAPGNVKTFASASLGIGGIFYPVAWILMGFRTTALGIDGAHQSVIPVAAISVFLIVAGLLATLFYTVKGVVKS